MTRAGDVRLASELGVDAVGFVFAARQPAPARARGSAGDAQGAGAAGRCGGAVHGQPRRRSARGRRARCARACCSSTAARTTPSAAASACRTSRPSRWRLMPAHAPSTRPAAMRYPGAVGLPVRQPRAGRAGRQRQDIRLVAHADRAGQALRAGRRPAARRTCSTRSCRRAPGAWTWPAASKPRPGIKDGDKMRRFVEEVRRADCHHE